MNILQKIKALFSKTDSMPPTNFFQRIKDLARPITQEDLVQVRQSLAEEILQFIETGQLSSAERLLFHLNTVGRELKAIEAGFTKYVYRDDLEDYILKVSKSVVKITELRNFERRIPKDKVETVTRAMPIFDDLIIVFTDYTGREERKVKKRDRAKDPIIFGTFHTKNKEIWNHRFYFITDWVDDFCDLTLDKFVSEMSAYTDHEVVQEYTHISVEELQERLKKAKEPASVVTPPNRQDYWRTITTTTAETPGMNVHINVVRKEE